MSKVDVLERLLDQARNGVFETSANYLMSLPKKGREVEWSEYKETAEVLEELLAELAG